MNRDFFKPGFEFTHEPAVFPSDCIRSQTMISYVVDLATDAASSVCAGMVALVLFTSPVQTWQRIVPSVVHGDEDGGSQTTSVGEAQVSPEKTVDDVWFSQPQDGEQLAKVLQLGRRVPGLDHLL